MKNPWEIKYAPIRKELERLGHTGVLCPAKRGVSIELCVKQSRQDEFLFKGVPFWPELFNRWSEQSKLNWPAAQPFEFGFHDLFKDKWREGIRESLQDDREYRAGVFLGVGKVSAESVLNEIALFSLLASDRYWAFFTERNAAFSLQVFRGKSVLEVGGCPRKWSKGYLEQGCRRFSEMVGSPFLGDFSGSKNIWWKCEFYDPAHAHAAMLLWDGLFGQMIRLNENGILPHLRVVRSALDLEVIGMHQIRQVCLLHHPLLAPADRLLKKV